MKVQEAILDVMEEVFGIEKDDLKEDLDLDLFENDLIDSLGIVTMLSELGEMLNKDFDISMMSPDNFRTVNNLTEAIEALM